MRLGGREVTAETETERERERVSGKSCSPSGEYFNVIRQED